MKCSTHTEFTSPHLLFCVNLCVNYVAHLAQRLRDRFGAHQSEFIVQHEVVGQRCNVSSDAVAVFAHPPSFRLAHCRLIVALAVMRWRRPRVRVCVTDEQMTAQIRVDQIVPAHSKITRLEILDFGGLSGPEQMAAQIRVGQIEPVHSKIARLEILDFGGLSRPEIVVLSVTHA